MSAFDINRRACVVGTYSAQSDEDCMTLWNRLADLAHWPAWNSAVRTMTVDGPPSLGTRFVWRAGGVTIRSQLAAFEPGAQLGWTGRTPGLQARHVWRFEPLGGGGTRITTEESFEGLLARLLPGPMRRLLERALKQGTDALIAAGRPSAAPSHN